MAAPKCGGPCPSGLECGSATCAQIRALNSRFTTSGDPCWTGCDGAGGQAAVPVLDCGGGGQAAAAVNPSPPELPTVDACLAPDPRNTGNTDALLVGFGVPSFELRTVRDQQQGTISFLFDAPENTTQVHCGLFACLPAITEQEVKAGFEADNDTTVEIANAAECMIGFRRILGPSGTFDVADPGIELTTTDTPESGGGGAACVNAAGASPKPRKTRLLAGCWAYGETKLTAATQLYPLRAAEVGAFRGLTTDCALPDTAGLACDLRVAPSRSTSVLGRCLESECRPQCLLASDCYAYSSAIEAPFGNTTAWTCEGNSSDLGICRPTNACASSESSQ